MLLPPLQLVPGDMLVQGSQHGAGADRPTGAGWMWLCRCAMVSVLLMNCFTTLLFQVGLVAVVVLQATALTAAVCCYVCHVLVAKLLLALPHWQKSWTLAGVGFGHMVIMLAAAGAGNLLYNSI